LQKRFERCDVSSSSIRFHNIKTRASLRTFYGKVLAVLSMRWALRTNCETKPRIELFVQIRCR